ncbi:uracil-xanthine permease family protein [Janibacter hoylei]|uniref:NCS2 family nucleotide:cation symporter-2 n=1 Tax=Janibacter hoylei PVAS-1 TaxID=1210046 RepID=K1DZJ9_9MICO|nr:solute carrier family 23 protein [Janibacter hoylei]EKA61754.1 NCS2 family nucleotide:cation symporter-2 [Janibacter hoylei PVAS-1]RWU85557.1 nitrate reductase [Janibacter hoylei PVAS-1]
MTQTDHDSASRPPFGLGWRVHGDGRGVRPGEVVLPGERLSWPRTIGLGAQHVVAMFGATFLVPLITGLPPATTLFFSGIGTMLFLLITAGRVPSYLGSSFAFIAPLAAASKSHDMPTALGGVVMAGLALALVGVVVQLAGDRWLRALMPPIVTGAIVALIGLNLAPTAKEKFVLSPVTALVTVVVILLVTVATRTLFSRIAILVGVAAGYVTALLRDEVAFTKVEAADWVGLPTFTAPHIDLAVAGLFVPVVLVLVAENVGHIRSVASMTGEDLDPVAGRALIADGLATTLAGAGGGSGTTTYAENIGVMAATRVYSTAAYWVAAAVALLLSFSPKFGEAIATVPQGVLGGAGVVLYGMIGLLGAKIWVEAGVDFGNPINLMTAAVALIIGIADFTWNVGDLQFAGIALGTVAALVGFHVMRGVNLLTRAVPDPLEPLDG